MNIITATADTKLFRNYLADKNGSLSSWQSWNVLLRALYGLLIKSKYELLIKKCTGRDITSFTNEGFQTALLLVGRRGGKSKISALVAAYEAVFSGREEFLSPGEKGLIAIISPTRFQSLIIKNYIRAVFASSPMLEAEVEKEDGWGFELSNGVRIQILTGDFRLARGFTLLTAIVDEACFFHLTEEGKIKSDDELVRAIRPGLATTGGKLIAISTKYAKKGWAYRTWKKDFANNEAKTLVWDSESKLMNPTLSQKIIDDAIAEDAVAARSEFLNVWREDIAIWLPREVIENVVKKGRKELLPRNEISYFAMADVSGGRADDAALAIAHRAEGKVIIDFVQTYKAPHNPHQVVSLMADKLHKFRIRKVVGDNYSAEFVASAFRSHGFMYEKCPLPKSELYLEFIPQICSNSIELLDDESSINQLANLERRVRSGGKDVVDHCHGGKDDAANVIAGVSFIVAKRKRIVGALPPYGQGNKSLLESLTY